MDLKERRETTMQRLQATVKLANEFEQKRANLMEQSLALSGEVRLLDELLKEEKDGPGRTTAKVGKGDAAS